MRPTVTGKESAVHTDAHPGGGWQVRIGEAADLHLALFIRDQFGIPARPELGHLTLRPTVLGPEPGDGVLTAAWERWWLNLLRARRGPAVGSPVGSLIRSHLLDDTPSLRELADGAHDDFVAWWGPPLGGQKRLLVDQIRGGSRPERDLLRRFDEPVSLEVEVLGLDREVGHVVSRDHLVVSSTLRESPGYSNWLESVVFPSRPAGPAS
jgi:hypothetical protein